VRLFSAFLLLVCSMTPVHAGMYRAPADIPGLPGGVRSALERQGCQIPLGMLDHTNAIKGSFAKRGQVDWAVLCSIAGRSHIELFWGGPARCPDQLAPHPDREYVFRDSGGKEECYRGLGIARREFIVSRHRVYGGPTPPPITHDGIDDRYVEKGSVVHYCHDGRWHQLTGAD
jgi:hypothetical protein